MSYSGGGCVSIFWQISIFRRVLKQSVYILQIFVTNECFPLLSFFVPSLDQICAAIAMSLIVV